MRRAWVRWWVAAAALAAMLWFFPGVAAHLIRSSAASPAGLPALGEVPDFSLVDQTGQPLSLGQLRGQVWIADFIFTRCAGQCPMMSAHLARLAEGFRATPGVQFVSFSVDPSYDRPEVLASYGRRYQANPAQWRFATGDPEAVRRLCLDGFKLSAQDGGAAQEPIIHSRRFVLVDGAGIIRGYYDAGVQEDLAALERAVNRLRGEPRS